MGKPRAEWEEAGPTAPAPTTPAPHRPGDLPRWGRPKAAGVAAALFALGLTLNTVGISWGQPGWFSWHPDSFAGVRAIPQMPKLFGQWSAKYPRGWFLAVAPFYRPLMARWEANPVTVPGPDGEVETSQFDMWRMHILIMIARWISALAGAASVVAVFLAGRRLFGDDLAGLLSGLALALTMDWVFYNHLGNVDALTTFWFAWATYFAVRAVQDGTWPDHVLLGFCAAMAVCTKDPAAGSAVGLGLGVWLGVIGRERDPGRTSRKAVLAFLNRRTLAMVLVAALVFALLNDLLTTPHAFFERMSYWMGGPGMAKFQVPGRTQFHLLAAAFKDLHYVMGWPLMAGTAAAVVYGFRKHPWRAAMCVAPLVAFYLIVVASTRLSVSRYYHQALAPLYLLTGKAGADFLRWARVPRLARYGAVSAAGLLSLLYCVGVDLALVHDPRYAAEQWLARHVDERDSVVALAQPSYSPRLSELPCPHGYVHHRPKDREMLEAVRPDATYIVLGESEWHPGGFDEAFLADLLAGKLGYTEEVRFTRASVWPYEPIFGIAGWPQRLGQLVSPTVIVLKREDGPAP